MQVLLKFKMATMDKLHNFLWAQASCSSMGALMSLMSDFNKRFTRLVITGIGEAACSSRYVLELGLDYMIFLVGAKTEKMKSVIIHTVLSHYPPSVNVHVILLKFKMATTNQLFKYL